MQTDTMLKLSAVAFATLWVALMWWNQAPMELPGVIALTVGGAIAGVIWYWLYGKWFRWYFQR